MHFVFRRRVSLEALSSWGWALNAAKKDLLCQVAQQIVEVLQSEGEHKFVCRVGEWEAVRFGDCEMRELRAEVLVLDGYDFSGLGDLDLVLLLAEVRRSGEDREFVDAALAELKIRRGSLLSAASAAQLDAEEIWGDMEGEIF